MADSLDTLSTATGISRAALKAIAEKVQANAAKLGACARHDFAPLGDPTRLGTKYRCASCGGEVDAHAFHWYTRGREHGSAAA